MTNSDLMELLALKSQDYRKRNAILLMSGIVLVAGIGILYILDEQNKFKQRNALLAEKNDSLNHTIDNQCSKMIDQQIQISTLQQNILSLQKILAATTAADTTLTA